jgi:UDP-glucose:(heptosyl)LPS alpha-1,3-glucosyltransferase
VAEQIERLAQTYEIHLYSERVEGVCLDEVTWHRVKIPFGPHLFRYVWWFAANHVCRWWDRYIHGLLPEVVYSPGVNCLDADLISVHVLFAKLRRELRDELRLFRNPFRTWPVVLHRRLYYWLIERLEYFLYGRKSTVLAPVSALLAHDIHDFNGRKDGITVVHHGIDAQKFSVCLRQKLRSSARAALEIRDKKFVVLLIGNDWKTKGLPCLLRAVSQLPDHGLHVLVVGNDLQTPYRTMIKRLSLENNVSFHPLRSDVEFYYAAADAYVGPSLEDAFCLPPAEAMACGLPVITTRMAGVSEIIHHGVDGLILDDPTDAESLSGWLHRLATDPCWCSQMGAAAAETATMYTCDQNAQQMAQLIEQVRKRRTDDRSRSSSAPFRN